MGKTNPLNDDDLKEFLKLQKKKADSDKSWTVNITDVNKTHGISLLRIPILMKKLSIEIRQRFLMRLNN